VSSHCVWDNLTPRGPLILSPAQQFVLRCSHCGERYVAALPASCGMLATICKQFASDHAECLPRKPAAAEFRVNDPCHDPQPVGPADPVPRCAMHCLRTRV
jgi:hypothetical protein